VHDCTGCAECFFGACLDGTEYLASTLGFDHYTIQSVANHYAIPAPTSTTTKTTTTTTVTWDMITDGLPL